MQWTGFQKLRAAGIEVTTGIGEEEARRLNEAFAKHIRTRTPLVVLKAAMTLDGKIAPPPGESENPSALGAGGATGGWITSEEARAHVHELRHAMDAIMVGVGTVVADDPLLTDRTGLPRRRPLLRVILDSRLRLPLESRVAKTCRDDVLRALLLRRGKEAQASWKRAAFASSRSRSAVADGRPDLRSIARSVSARWTSPACSSRAAPW